MSTDGADNPARIRIHRRIEWIDTDAAGIYHWTTVIRYAEAAEAALHNALGITEQTFGITPRVNAGFDFHRPLYFNDPVVIDFAVQAVGRSSVRYGVALTDAQQRAVAEGTITTCLVDRELSRSVPWPDAVRRALSEGGPQPDG